MLGIRGTIEKVLNANGPAQHLLCAGWGIVVAGMFQGSHIHDYLLIAWATLSFLILVSVVWLSLATLQAFLLMDAVLSVVILILYLTHVEVVAHYIYMPSGEVDWEQSNYMEMSPVSEWSYTLACVYMAVHGFYLANLVQRQRYERRRFDHGD